MSDSLISWMRTVIVGLGFGSIAAAAAFAALNVAVAKVMMGWLIAWKVGDVAKGIAELRDAGLPEWLASVLGETAAFVTGPGLPVTVGLIVAIVAVPLLRLEVRGRRVVERLWPGPPDILDRRLERPGVDATDPYSPHRPFLGREAEMGALMVFAGPASGDGPAVMALTGAEGMGKTRVALAWLARLNALGWDVGVLKETSPLDLERARFRKRTAIVIDEPSASLTDIWTVLDRLTAKRGRLRILVADQIAPARSPGPRESETLTELRLEPIPDGVLTTLAPGLAPSTRIAAEGRPLYVLLGDDPARTVAARAHKRLMAAGRLGGGEAERLLALAALAGPAPHRNLGRPVGTNVPVLRQLFEGAPSDVVKHILPGLKPARFADAVLLQYAGSCTDGYLRDLMAQALAANAAAVESRLGSLWAGPALAAGDADIRLAMQTQFDAAEPGRVAAARDDMARWVDEINRPPKPGKNGKPDLKPVESALEQVSARSAARPFDRAVRLQEARAGVNAVLQYGAAACWDELERWGARLVALARTAPFRDDPAIRLREAKGAVNAISQYGKAGKWADLERWGALLATLAATAPFRDDPAIRREEAKAVLNTVRDYGMVGRWDDLERWGTRLARLAETPPFRSDPAIRHAEAGAVVNAVYGYGGAGRWGDLERWGNRLAALVATAPFRDDPDIRLNEAEAAYNALKSYGDAGRWDELEHWGNRLAALVATAPFHDDPAIRLIEAYAIVNTINSYGKASRWDDLERWGTRLAKLVATAPFRDHPTFRLEEAKAVVNAIRVYGTVSRWEDLERWGDQLTTLLATAPFGDHSAFRLEEAQAIVNAIGAYGRVGRWNDLERWGNRLVKLVAAAPSRDDPAIQLQKAQAAGNAILAYNTFGLRSKIAAENWRTRLAAIAHEFPLDSAIQEVASHFGLDAVAQITGTPRYGNTLPILHPAERRAT